MLWNLNRYRFGKLMSTSVSPHGVRTRPPSAGSGRRGRRAYRAASALQGASRDGDRPQDRCNRWIRGPFEETLGQFDGSTSAALGRSWFSDTIAPSS